MKEVNHLKSQKIKNLVKFHLNKGHKITFFGSAWSSNVSDWVYFDTTLDIPYLIKIFDPEQTLLYHENTDHKSGTEKGLIDTNTMEGIMGLLD